MGVIRSSKVCSLYNCLEYADNDSVVLCFEIGRNAGRTKSSKNSTHTLPNMEPFSHPIPFRKVAMKSSLIILALVHHAMVASGTTMIAAAPLVGHARTVEDSDVKAALEELARGIPDFLLAQHVARSLNGRNLNSALDKLGVLVQNVDCHACMVSEATSRTVWTVKKP